MRPRRSRVLLVGTGAPGGIGRVEQMLSEAALEHRARHGTEFRALWRRRHPDYLRSGAIDSIPASTPARHAGGNADYVSRLARDIARFGPDFVLYAHSNLARPAPWLRALGHPPYAVWAYGIEIWERLSSLHRLALRRAEAVLAISAYTLERTVEAQGVDRARMRVVPLTLPQEMFNADGNGDVHEPGRLLTVSRLARTEEGKGLEPLIRAFADLSRRDDRARLVVIGDGDDRLRLERIAAEAGVGEAVQFLGGVSDAELRQQYRRADLFVLPSAKEGFGLVFLEAMLYGTPVVGLATGGPLELVRDGLDGRLIDRVDELADNLEELLSDRGRLARMRAHAVERARNDFSPERFRSRLFTTLEM